MSENETCRFCNYEIETAQQLLFDCEFVNLDRSLNETVEEFVKRVSKL